MCTQLSSGAGQVRSPRMSANTSSRSPTVRQSNCSRPTACPASRTDQRLNPCAQEALTACQSVGLWWRSEGRRSHTRAAQLMWHIW
ncbi:hypothetical protein BC628DRAFT_1358664 [Trametes gibbosa]|nr:hypothetical protein BC628DRAFT_1358664 [Trametes gibbosa]